MQEIKKSFIHKQLLNNLSLFGVTDIARFPTEDVVVTSTLLGNIQYFSAKGIDCPFLFRYKEKSYCFRTKKDMTVAIEILLRDKSISDSSINYFELQEA